MDKTETVIEILESKNFRGICDEVGNEIKQIYLENSFPWVVCFSGGKDSTAMLQIICDALSQLPRDILSKELHVITNNTMVENPFIETHILNKIKEIEEYGKTKLYRHSPELFHVEIVKPKLSDLFWVNLIGNGYPSPNRWFRWCTERLKINPTSNYIQSMLKNHEKVIIVLGTRKAESGNRAASMKSHDKGDKLRNHTINNALVYAPLADLSTNDVWAYLLQTENPWGGDNLDLLELYGNACSGGECPFVIETGTQSCGKSRFGCWVCTVVDRDKSMENFVKNGEKWAKPLLDFRNWIYDIRQQNNQFVPESLEFNIKFGAFLLKTREEILSRLLKIQNDLNLRLISDEELGMVNKLLEEEGASKVNYGNSRFIYKMPEGNKIAVISDYNLADTRRKRLGPLSLKNAKLISTEDVKADYLKSTRVIYYLCESDNGDTGKDKGGNNGYNRQNIRNSNRSNSGKSFQRQKN